MKKLKINLALLAIVLGVTAAYATSAPARPAATLYGFDQSTGLWELTRPASHCQLNPSKPCEAEFNGDPNNGGTEVPGSQTNGNFIF
ncbi:MAG: hypothetical protein JWQ66_4679 [Mucilaginibacter sp.]|nr:hypothetical protein [Mucilaginibacter sp.]